MQTTTTFQRVADDFEVAFASAAPAQRPSGMCPVCSRVAYGLEWCGQCPTQSGEEQCKGWMRATVSNGDWTECEPCNAVGRDEGWECFHCNGIGWLFTRAGGFDGAQPKGKPIIGRLC